MSDDQKPLPTEDVFLERITSMETELRDIRAYLNEVRMPYRVAVEIGEGLNHLDSLIELFADDTRRLFTARRRFD